MAVGVKLNFMTFGGNRNGLAISPLNAFMTLCRCTCKILGRKNFILTNTCSDLDGSFLILYFQI